MKNKLFLLFILLSGCAKYEPVVDLRASDDQAHLYHRDLGECRTLIDSKKSRLVFDPRVTELMLNRCLEGRGHSVLNSIER